LAASIAVSAIATNDTPACVGLDEAAKRFDVESSV
jgi:hypothetical protein